MVIAEPVNSPDGWSLRSRIAEPWTACGWSQASQTIRFQRVVEALKPEPGEWVYDFGCGTGDLSAHLDAEVGYYGYDWSTGMVARAASVHGAANRRFKTHEPTSGHWFDLVACIGPFNLPGNWSKERTWHVLRHLWDTTGCRALAVCLYAGDDENCLHYTEDEAARAGRQLGLHTLERILPNDLMLVVKR